jgi:serine/threonine protein kinase
MEKLGVGSFGTVYKAMHNETKQIVAIKQIGASLASPPTLFALVD